MHDALRARGLPVSAAVAAFGVGITLAAHHPTHPWLAPVAFVLGCAAAFRFAGLWLFVLPAGLPMASLAPWTGWIVFEEFDLIVMGAMAAGFARLASPAATPAPCVAAGKPGAKPRAVLVPVLLFAVSAALSFVRGFSGSGSGSPAFGWYDGHVDPLNALRVGKSVLYAMLLLPLLQQEVRHSKAAAVRRVAAGMLAGTSVVVAAVIWERAAYPGLFDFSEPYRTVALFWEMHVGGAAIDAYLALAMPFVAGAVMQATTPQRWTAAATLALLGEYACLTTFSRGVYLAVTGSMIVLGIVLAQRGVQAAAPPWRRRAGLVLIIAMILQAVAVVGSDSFMLARMKRSTQDFGSRLAHWHNGLRLLHGPTDWWLGKGLGRLPAEYAASAAERELSGDARVVSGLDGAHLSLSGPRSTETLAGLYALTQRVPNAPIAYRAAFDVRTDKTVRIGVKVCETHLLYDSACQHAVARVIPGGAVWQRVALPLHGSPMPSSGWPSRTAVFSITLLDVDEHVELDSVFLGGDGTANVLRNADFSNGLAHWFPVAKDYFVPWHIDNLYLELLIEQGIVGLSAFALWVGYAFAALLSPRTRGLPEAPFLVASLAGALLVGLVSSLLDVPRVAFLLFFLMLLSIQLSPARDAIDPQ